MLNLPVVRWGKPYQSLETEEVVHFDSGEPIARVSQANGGLIARDMRRADQARRALRRIPPGELIECMARAADLFSTGTLAMGDGSQGPGEFAFQQSASTGLPEHMCRKNMEKNSFVLRNMGEILDALTRGLQLDILARGYGMESRGVVVSYQAQAPALGAVLPSNSPGVHTLWLPVIALQIGLVLKPGPQEPWTPYRMISAMVQAGVPEEVFAIYPGGAEAGAAVVSSCRRVMVFGSQQTVDQYRGNPRVQAHGPGFSKILLGDDVVDRWEDYLDVMEESVYINGGRSCINCSGIWASRHTREIAEALAQRLGPVDVLPPGDADAGLAAFTVPGMGQAIWNMIEQDLDTPGASDMTAAFGPRLVERPRCSFLRPMIVHCDRPDSPIANKEFMFPFASVVRCPQAEMIQRIGPTLVGTVISEDRDWIEQLADATHIDRLNVGPIPTNRLNWLQPHEGNLIDFLFRSRAFQTTQPLAATT